jgi:antitoxin component of MazEF toxin-antitoxin module
MKTTLARWGGGVGLRLPKAIALAAGLKVGDAVHVEACENGVRICKGGKQGDCFLEDLFEDGNRGGKCSGDDWGERLELF